MPAVRLMKHQAPRTSPSHALLGQPATSLQLSEPSSDHVSSQTQGPVG
jgi:hypothetical protein